MTIRGQRLSFRDPLLLTASLLVMLAGVPADILSYTDVAIVVRAMHTQGNGDPADVVIIFTSGASAFLASAWSPLASPPTEQGNVIRFCYSLYPFSCIAECMRGVAYFVLLFILLFAGRFSSAFNTSFAPFQCPPHLSRLPRFLRP